MAAQKQDQGSSEPMKSQNVGPSAPTAPTSEPATEPVPPVLEATAEPPAPAARTGYAVASDVHLSSLRGVLVPGEAVSARDFFGGQEALSELLERKLVVRT